MCTSFGTNSKCSSLGVNYISSQSKTLMYSHVIFVTPGELRILNSKSVWQWENVCNVIPNFFSKTFLLDRVAFYTFLGKMRNVQLYDLVKWDWICCFGVKQKQPMAFLAEKMSSTLITANYKQNGSENFSITVSVRKVTQNSRGSQNLLLKGKMAFVLEGHDAKPILIMVLHVDLTGQLPMS